MHAPGRRSVVVVSPYESATSALHELASGFRTLSPLHSVITFLMAPPSRQAQQVVQLYGNRGLKPSESGIFAPPPGVEFIVRHRAEALAGAGGGSGAGCPWAWLHEPHMTASGRPPDSRSSFTGSVEEEERGALDGVDAVVVLRQVAGAVAGLVEVAAHKALRLEAEMGVVG